MALELETRIMQEIGLGRNYRWHNGSGSCLLTRQKAVEQLPKVIQQHHDAHEVIAPPDEGLIAVLRSIAMIGEESMYVLTNTWQAISYVIAEHIHQADKPAQDRATAYQSLQMHLEQQYLPQR